MDFNKQLYRNQQDNSQDDPNFGLGKDNHEHDESNWGNYDEHILQQFSKRPSKSALFHSKKNQQEQESFGGSSKRPMNSDFRLKSVEYTNVHRETISSKMHSIDNFEERKNNICD